MKKTTFLVSTLIAGCLSVSIVSAQTKTPVINERQKNQERRIEQGEKSGQLTNKEATKLQNDENQIQQQKQAEKTAGTVTPVERKQLRKEENQTSKEIYNKKHNSKVK